MSIFGKPARCGTMFDRDDDTMVEVRTSSPGVLVSSPSAIGITVGVGNDDESQLFTMSYSELLQSLGGFPRSSDALTSKEILR